MLKQTELKLLDLKGQPPEPCPLWVVALLERTVARVCAAHRVTPEAIRDTATKTPPLVAALEEIARTMFAAYPKRGVLAREWGVKYEAVRRWCGRDEVAPPKRRCA